uniref:Uncharacterized protein n=1 Tax=Cacopsylla melanoneura TaxID=428564 RepID=A0A8D8UM65_9HEMI
MYLHKITEPTVKTIKLISYVPYLPTIVHYFIHQFTITICITGPFVLPHTYFFFFLSNSNPSLHNSILVLNTYNAMTLFFEFRCYPHIVTPIPQNWKKFYLFLSIAEFFFTPLGSAIPRESIAAIKGSRSSRYLTPFSSIKPPLCYDLR